MTDVRAVRDATTEAVHETEDPVATLTAVLHELRPMVEVLIADARAHAFAQAATAPRPALSERV